MSKAASKSTHRGAGLPKGGKLSDGTAARGAGPAKGGFGKDTHHKTAPVSKPAPAAKGGAIHPGSTRKVSRSPSGKPSHSGNW